MSVDPAPLPLAIIDEEHRNIHRALVNATNSIVLGEPLSTSVALADNILDVTLLHIEHEEALLRIVKFRYLRSHRREHILLVAMLREAISELRSKATAAAFAILQNFRAQLVKHLQVTDEKYRESVNRYITSKGMSPLPPRIRHTIQ